MTKSNELLSALRGLASGEKAKSAAWFFKTEPGEYGYGDRFLGVTVPEQRKVARRFKDLPLPVILQSLKSPWHEERLTALFVMIHHFQCALDDDGRKGVVDAYLKHLAWVNNWDLVDSSARHILGEWLFERDRKVLYRLAKSSVLWERRISVIATHAFIMRGESAETLKLASLLLEDEEDLMHKAVGWMLREIGKRVGMADLREFLAEHAAVMPRTMLRYSIEHMDPAERKKWMA